MDAKPTLLMIPCFAGAPWDLDQMHPLTDWPLRTVRLPEHSANLETLADFVVEQADDLAKYVLVGDSFGAVISLAVAVREPQKLVGLVLSGGFARNPITSPMLKALAALAPFFPGPLYRQLTLRMHAAQLSSRFDVSGEIPWTADKTRQFFARETPHHAYVARVRAVADADYVAKLSRISVPTLILTPEEDRLIGKEAAATLINGIRNAQEIILPQTGHMFRFSSPTAYSKALRTFLSSTSFERGQSL